MEYLLTAIAFIVIFSILILIHELGHFVMAKRAGIKVEEFGFGLPPRIWGKKKGETTYSINWIPFGGFVRMLGEDATDSSMLRKKRSFVSARMRDRVKVVIAGVVMNFFLAWILLTIGFAAGMEPLLGPDDVLPAVESGVIELEEGIKIKGVEKETLAYEIGFEAEDILYSLDGEVIDLFTVQELAVDPSGTYKVIRGGKFFTYEILPERVEDIGFDNMGFQFYDFTAFPRVKVFEIDTNSEVYGAGLRRGDTIISVNGAQVFSIEDYEEIVRGEESLEYVIFRDGFREEFVVNLDSSRNVLIDRVLPGSPAEMAGLQSRDIILSVNGKNVNDSLELIEFVGLHGEEILAYTIERQGQEEFFEIKPEEGKIGVLLSELIDEGVTTDLSLYNSDQISSAVKINKAKYPIHIAAYNAFGEGFRMAKMTGQMFVSMVGNLISGGEVSEAVGGPVRIATYTHIFVQEGIIPLLRFVAILSLSLAVINILPFPALDGGRLFFILIEFILGKRVNQKWEAYIHAFGFALIILLMVVVTYTDIARLFI